MAEAIRRYQTGWPIVYARRRPDSSAFSLRAAVYRAHGSPSLQPASTGNPGAVNRQIDASGALSSRSLAQPFQCWRATHCMSNATASTNRAVGMGGLGSSGRDKFAQGHRLQHFSHKAAGAGGGALITKGIALTK